MKIMNLDALTLSIRNEILQIIQSINPLDCEEKEHIHFATKWIASGAEIFRIAKPALPDPHLVTYFLLIDPIANQVLLVDHKKASLWLPPGGHVELNEHPTNTVQREVVEELGIRADFLSQDPFFMTVTKTIGHTAGHTDVSLWYILKGCTADMLEFDEEEFQQIRWFLPDAIPYPISDPHMRRCITKLISLKILRGEISK